MKMRIHSQWKSEIFVPARVKQFVKASKLCKKSSFRQYAGLISADSERAAVDEWLDSVSPLRQDQYVA